MKTIGKILKTDISKFIMISFIPVIISTVAVFLTDTEDILWLRMVWNYFLAVIPVYMALFALHFKGNNKMFLQLFSMCGWLLFFPNSIYMLTDFKYLCKFVFDLWDVYNTLSDNIFPWILLLNLIISITLGILAGMISLDMIHLILKSKFSKKTCLLIIVGISVISSFGVYIGRYARLNSWDIINPIKIITKSFEVMSGFAVAYIGIFTVVTLFLYSTYVFIKKYFKSQNGDV